MDDRTVERAAEKYLEDNKLLNLPVDPIAIAENNGIIVEAKPVSNTGVSGMLIKYGNTFCIGYATHIDNEGFQRYSIAHELGHYFLPGHPESLFPEDGIHQSKAGFLSENKYEREADHYAAGLLMPKTLFKKEIDRRKSGYDAINKLANKCRTSLTATAIRYTQFTPEPMAAILSEGSKIDWCFMSDELKEIGQLDWPRKGQTLPRDTITFQFNKKQENIDKCQKENGGSSFMDWFGGNHDFEIEEETVGLGGYGKTLTILTITEDLEAMNEHDELRESWTPRFKR